MTQQPLFPAAQEPVVLSASRRTDLVNCYPDLLVEKLRDYPPDRVHSIVIWTKNPQNMLAPGALRETLGRYSQLYVHLTVTGLGGTVLEPHIPPWRQVAGMVPALVDLVRVPQCISWRFDPVVRCRAGERLTENLPLFDEIAPSMAGAGVTCCRTSWVEPYRKVLQRLEKKGVVLMPHSPEERGEHARRLEQAAAGLGMTVHYCSMEGFQRSSCIDGELLARLHPTGAACSTRRAKGQRRLCGCTESIDLGWYSLKCRSGCLYCYAEPLID